MKKFLAVCLMAMPFLSNAQLTVSGGFTAQQLAEMLAGPNITVFNAKLTGAPAAAGKFSGVKSNIGIPSGVILSTGNIQNAPGPNNNSSAGTALGRPGDAALSTIAGVETHDAVVLEFQFQVQSEAIEFNYVFASEEYPEFAPPNGGVNDVFAFFISGPGISGDENIALVPNTTAAVSINNINAITHWQYYVDNTTGATVQFDAFTTLLKAKKSGLIPCETYTLKLKIADASDEIYDSGVFLQENSLIQPQVTAISQTVNADSVSLEGCTRASFTFSLDSVKSTPTKIYFNIGGTATNGVDYKYIDSVFTIPAGQKSATIFIDPLADGYTEGQEKVMLIYRPTPCSTPDTVMLYINDAQPLNFSLTGVNPVCGGDSTGQILINATGGFPPYSFTIVGGATYASSPITNLPAGPYTIRVNDTYGCKADAVAIGSVFDAGATFLPDGNGQTYETSINISGFQAGQKLQDVSQLQSICASLEHSSMGEVTIDLIAPDGNVINLKQSGSAGTTDFGEPVAKGPTDGGNSDITPGKGYNYCWTTSPTFKTMMLEAKKYKHTYVDNTGKTLTDNYLPAGSYQSFESLVNLVGSPLNGIWKLRIKDNNPQDNGYIFNWGISLKAGLPDSTVTLVAPASPVFTTSATGAVTQPTCGSTNGAINITPSGKKPFTFLWSNGATTEDISGLGAGSYKVTITDSSSCKYDTTFLLNNVSSLAASSIITQVTCAGMSNGSVNLTVSGGTKPYSILWNNGSTSEDLADVAAGTYTATITDSTGCKTLHSATVTQVPGISIQSSITNEKCGAEDGSISLSVSGGTAPYSYAWSNGSSGSSANYLEAGSYTVTVKDANNCSSVGSYSLINEVSACVIICDLSFSSKNITHEVCGNSAGAIDITVSGGAQPYTYSWAHGSSAADQNNLPAGKYFLTVTDINSCSLTDSFTVSNVTGTLVVSGVVTNENCGNKLGAVDISVSGGAMPYSYYWSNAAVTQDITALSAGTYSVKVTDANGCSHNSSYNVVNNSGSLVQTYGNAMDEYCGKANGSVDITIAGGVAPYNFLWSNGATTQDLLNVPSGTYYAVITDWSGCKITTPLYTIGNNTGTLSFFDIDVVNETCSNSQGRINVDVTGGVSPYTYNWNQGQTTQAISGLPAGTYFVSVTDSKGCVLSSSGIVVQNSSGTLSLDKVTVVNETCGNKMGQVSLTISGGSKPYEFLWNTGSTSQNLTGLSAGNYTAQITDSLGCKVSAEANVINTSGSLAITNVVVSHEVCGNAAGAVNIYMNGGTLPYNFNWSNGASTEDLAGINAGSYTVNVTDAGGCKVSKSVIVENKAGTLSIGVPAITNETCGASNGSIDISVTGGSSPYSFAWSNGMTTEDISSLAAGTYTGTVTDFSGCKVSTGSITINNSAPGMTIASSITAESCGLKDGAIDISVSGGSAIVSYMWSNGAFTQDINGIAAGTYSVTVTDDSGCTTTKSFTVPSNSGGFAISGAAITNEVCSNKKGAVNISLTGGSAPFIFKWSNGTTTEDLVNIAAGTYSVTITDAGGCKITSSSYNVQNSPGTLSVDNVFVLDEKCNDNLGEVDITVSGGTAPYTFLWSTGATSEDVANLSSGVYSATVKDNAGCSLSVSATVGNSSGTMAISSEIVKNATCGDLNGSVTLSVSGGTVPYSYVWSNGSTDPFIDSLPAGNYSVLVTDSMGCSAFADYEILSKGADLAIAGISIKDESCVSFSGAVYLTVAGGSTPYSYLWNNGATTEDATGLSAGTYSVTVTDANGCSVGASAIVQKNNNSDITISSWVQNPTCGMNNGYISVNAMGSGFYDYSWNTGQFGSFLSDLGAGSYVCTITDLATGCIAVFDTVLTGSGFPIVIDSVTVVNDYCNKGKGSIAVFASGGAGPLTYSWSNGGSTSNISNLTAGTYYCDIYDPQNCIVSITRTITSPTFTVFGSVKGASCSTCANGSVDLTVSSLAKLPLTYQWSNGATTEDVTGLLPGTYNVLVTDASGCVVSKYFVISISTGVMEATDGAMKIFPNPAIGEITIDFPEAKGLGYGLQLYDMYGRLLLAKEVSGALNTIDVAHLATGNYVVRVVQGDKMYIHKLIINR